MLDNDYEYPRVLLSNDVMPSRLRSDVLFNRIHKFETRISTLFFSFGKGFDKYF